MSNPAIPDIISVVGTSYLQPISDLLEKLLKRPVERQGPAGTGHHENGYSAAIIVLLVTVLESYAARLRFVRVEEETAGNLSTPALLAAYFPALPTREELIEVFLCRNVLAHNHIWHLDVSDCSQFGSPTLATPAELGFRLTNITTKSSTLPRVRPVRCNSTLILSQSTGLTSEKYSRLCGVRSSL